MHSSHKTSTLLPLALELKLHHLRSSTCIIDSQPGCVGLFPVSLVSPSSGVPNTVEYLAGLDSYGLVFQSSFDYHFSLQQEFSEVNIGLDGGIDIFFPLCMATWWP